MIGTVLGGRYTILEEVGKGGMAHVYKAQCNVLNRVVAVKMLRTDLEGGDEFVNRFNAEAQSAACLAHPNIVSIYDVGEENGLYYIVMEYIEGITLKEYIKEKGKLSSEESAEIASQICAALTIAHEKNIIHRDIKPHNIMVTSNNLIKVTDFGIARASNNATMQVGDSILGSVHYISPEQARGGYVDGRSDIYSLGIVLYEMLTGKLPFESESPIAIAMKHLEEMPVAPQTLCPDVSSELQDIVLKAISKETRKRYQSVAAMKSDLDVVVNMLKTSSETAINYIQQEDSVEEDLTAEEAFINSYDNIDNASDEYDYADEVNEYSSEDNYQDEEYEEEYTNEDEEYYDDDEDYDDSRRLSFNMIFTAIIIALVVVGGSSLLIGSFVFPDAPIYTMMRAFWGNNDVEVPTFVGKQVNEANEVAEQFGLKIEVIESEFGPESEGVITQQSIASGNSVKKGTTITIHTSKGPDPDLFNDDNFAGEPESAIDKYEKKGYNVEKKYKSDNSFAKGDIVEVVLNDNKIIFYINAEDEINENRIAVPNLRGLTINQARARLEDAGLLLYEESEYDTRESSEIEEGKVVSQSESAGTLVNPKSQIKIYIARKPVAEETSETPETTTESTEPSSPSEGAGSANQETTTTPNASTESTPATNANTAPETPPAEKVSTRNISLDMSSFTTTTHVKIVANNGSVIFNRNIDPSTQPEINLSLTGSGTITYNVLVNGAQYTSYSINFEN